MCKNMNVLFSSLNLRYIIYTQLPPTTCLMSTVSPQSVVVYVGRLADLLHMTSTMIQCITSEAQRLKR